MAVSESKKALIDARREAGACIDCGEDSDGKQRCQKCAEGQKASRQKAIEARKAAGVCQNATSHGAAMPGRTVCQECSDKASACASARYQKNKKKGVCRCCGEDSGGASKCDDCKEKEATWKSDSYQDRKARGVCVDCDGKYGELVTEVYCEYCRQQKIAASRARWAQLKLDAFTAYGGPECSGIKPNGKPCGEDDITILELDHVDGGGNQHRKSIGQSNIYLWLKQNDYPEGYRVLCPTCNKRAHVAARRSAG